MRNVSGLLGDHQGTFQTRDCVTLLLPVGQKVNCTWTNSIVSVS